MLFESDPEAFASQIVKNAYDALEQALSAGIAALDEEIPRRHGAKIQRYFEPLGAKALEQTAFDWHSRRSNARYVDFRGSELSIPSKNFDRNDAESILADTETLLEFVRERIGDA